MRTPTHVINDRKLEICQDICSVMIVPFYVSKDSEEVPYEAFIGYKVIARTPFKTLQTEGFDEWVYTEELDSSYPYVFPTQEQAEHFANVVTVDGEIRERQWKCIGCVVLRTTHKPIPSIK